MIAVQYETEEDTVWAPVMGEARGVKQSYAWRLRLPVCIVLGMAAAVFLVVGLSRQAPGTVSEGDDYDTTADNSILHTMNADQYETEEDTVWAPAMGESYNQAYNQSYNQAA